jgi:hypothetical protein
VSPWGLVSLLVLLELLQATRARAIAITNTIAMIFVIFMVFPPKILSHAFSAFSNYNLFSPIRQVKVCFFGIVNKLLRIF